MKRIVRSNLVAVGAVALLVAMAVGASAQGGRPGRGMGPGGPMGPGGAGRGFMGLDLPIMQLGLSDDQQGRIREVMQHYRPEMQTLGDRLGGALDAQRKAIETVPVNEGLVRSTSDVVAAAESDMAVLRAHVHADVFAVLTPDQQAKAAQITANREAKRKQFQQGGPGNMRKRPN